MSLHMIRDWKHLAVNTKILDKFKDSLYLKKIISKFQDSRIQTESLANSPLFSFRIGQKERVICKSHTHQQQDCLIIIDILENHQYKDLKNNPSIYHVYDVLVSDNDQDLTQKNKLIQSSAILVASTQEALNHNTLTRELSVLPRVSRTNFDNKTIILSNEQHQILNSINENSGIFAIHGTAGSGKTLLASLLLSNTLLRDDDHRALYVTKSEKLVNEINKQLHNNLSSENSNKDILKNIDIKTYDDFCKDLGFKNTRSNLEDFTTWIQDKQEFIKYIQSLKSNKQNNASIIAQEIYEDIRKLHDNRSIGKKQSYDHKISKNILNLYQKYLEESNKSNLELLNDNAINNHTSYHYIIVDEAQDFGKSTLKIIMSCLNKDIATNKTTGSMYLFMDTNQSLLDDFNLVSSYIKELSKSNNIKFSDYILTYNYRSPQSIITLARNVINIKNVIIGGNLSKSAKNIIESKDNTDNEGNTGYIKYINRDDTGNVDIQDQEIVNNLKKEISHSIETALIIPDKALLDSAHDMFRDALVFTPEAIRGLEFKKVILFNFISGKYPNNVITAKELKNISLFKDKTQHNFPKDIQQAKAGGKHSKFFNNLFIGITRSTNSVYFIETEGEKFKSFKDFLDTNHSTEEDIILGSSSLLEMLTKVQEIHQGGYSSNVIEQYLQKVCTHIKENNITQNEISSKSQEFLTNIASSSNIANQILDYFKTISSENPIPVITRPLDINQHNKFSKVPSNQHKTAGDISLQLRQEADKGNLEQVKKYCSKKTINSQSSNGNTALHWAVLKRHHDVIKYLASNPHIQIDAQNNEGKTPLSLSIINLDKKGTYILIQYGAGKKNLIDNDGYTPLDHAFKAEASYITTLLQNTRPDMGSHKDEEISAEKYKMYIKSNQSIIMPQIFDPNYFFDVRPGLENKISPFFQPGNQFTLDDLKLAVSDGRLDINKIHVCGNLLHSTAVSRIETAQKFKWLFENAANPNIQASVEFNPASYKNTPAHTLIANEDEQNTLEYLDLASSSKQKIKLDLNLTDSEGKTLLCLATKVGINKVVIKLLHMGADPNIRDEYGNTPLHYALLLGRINIANELIKYNANKNIKNNINYTAFELLNNSSKEDIEDCLNEIWINPDRKESNTTTHLAKCTMGRKIMLERNIGSTDNSLNKTQSSTALR